MKKQRLNEFMSGHKLNKLYKGISRKEQQLLAAHAAGLTREAWIAQQPLDLSAEQQATYDDALKRRTAGEPVAKIIGKKAFWKHEFHTNAHTLDPRPESELIIEAVLAHRPERDHPWDILDCGTGSGCLLLSLLYEYPNATGTGIDRSEEAIATAKNNIHIPKMPENLNQRATFACLNWTLWENTLYDIVVSNPPYIPTHDVAELSPEVAHYDPFIALDGGNDGLDAYRELLKRGNDIVKDQGLFVCEIGIGQRDAVCALAETNGFICLEVLDDLAGIPRTIVAQKHAS